MGCYSSSIRMMSEDKNTRHTYVYSTKSISHPHLRYSSNIPAKQRYSKRIKKEPLTLTSFPQSTKLVYSSSRAQTIKSTYFHPSSRSKAAILAHSSSRPQSLQLVHSSSRPQSLQLVHASSRLQPKVNSKKSVQNINVIDVQQKRPSYTCSNKPVISTPQAHVSTPQAHVSTDQDTQLTRDVVAQHNSKTDGWIILKGQVYNITKFLRKHPGGPKVLYDVLGRDGTLTFKERHPRIDPTVKLRNCYVGPLVE